jgi:hypothetical protein
MRSGTAFLIAVAASLLGIRAAADQAPDRVTPEAYGAATDDDLDDTDAVQQALDFAAQSRGKSVVWLSPGKGYRLHKPLRLKSGAHLASDPDQPATLRAMKDDALFQMVVGAGVTDVALSGLRFINDHLPANEAAGNVVSFARDCARLRFTRCHFGSTPQGRDGRGGRYYLRGLAFERENMRDITIENCSFEWLKYGVLTNSDASDHARAVARNTPILSDLRVLNCRFDHISGDAVELNHPGSGGLASAIVVAGNTLNVPAGIQADGSAVLAAAGFCVGVAGAHQVRIEANRMSGCRWQAIHLEDHAKDIIIRGNQILGPGPQGYQGSKLSAHLIHILESEAVVIENNSLKNAARSGIHIQCTGEAKPGAILIRDNTIEQGGHIGIYSQTPGQVKIEGGTVRGFDCGVKIYLQQNGTSILNTRLLNLSGAALRTSRPQDRFAQLEGLVFKDNARDFDFATPQIVNGATQP